MDIFDSRYFQINRLTLSCVGLWVYQSAAKKRLAKALIFLSLTTTLIPQINFLFSVWGDIDAVFECLPPFGLVLISASQLCLFAYHNKKLLSLVECMKRDWKVWSSGKELEILQIHAEEGKYFTLLYTDRIIPLNETRPKQLVYAAKFPFNQDEYFEWIVVHGAITSFYNMSIIYSCEGMLGVTTQHACGLFAIISYRLKNIIKLNEENVCRQEQLAEDKIYKEISSTIYLHNQALEYAKTLNSCYSHFLFMTVGLNVLTLSVSGIQTINALGNTEKTIKFGAPMLGCFIHLYFISLPAQNLTDCSLNVTNDVYNGLWYLFPIKSRKLLILIIRRSQNPCYLTAGKICTMGMVSFSSLVQTSLSYFTLLSSVR
ncbi:putative odorant receptor 85d isoform X2 [Belonocnema kinseyi]|uniref:putative odorant receptor 85d isoform X2 n=1 Tax=Belonocnema kinseyi TaxID=2817044 RepID=UPI00143D4EF1|nr:putative odorant receptor 85d isoform X2 [Belonocnema kinseyi]